MPAQAGGIVEYFSPGDHITCTAGGTITGGQLVELTGNRSVTVAGAASNAVLGVALHNAVSGEKVTVATDGVWPLTASGAIATGNRVISAAAGAVSAAGAAPDARQVIGFALEAISGAATGRVKLTN
jgi:predicted RecA/RadA family phage recombinase